MDPYLRASKGKRFKPDIESNHSRIRRENVKRFVARTKRLQLDYSCGKITLDKVCRLG